MKQRIAVVAVSALTAGLFSVVSAPVANAATGDVTVGANGGAANVAVGTCTSYGLISGAGAVSTTVSAVMYDSGTMAILVDNAAAKDVLTITGGTFTSFNSGGTAPVLTGLTTIGSDATDGDYCVLAKPAAAGTLMVIKSYTAPTAKTASTGGTLVDTITTTVSTAANAGTFSSSNSRAQMVTTAAVAAVTSNADSAAAPYVANGSAGLIAFSLNDANSRPMSTSTVISASATGGAVVSLDGVTYSTSISGTYGGTFGNVYVAQGTANAPVAATAVTLSVSGATYVTKNFRLAGDVASITLSGASIGKIGGANAAGFYLAVKDSSGGLIDAITPSASASSINASVSAVTPAASSVLDVSAQAFTCSTTAGTSTITYTYTNAANVKITSNALPVTCAGDPYKYTASLDKASYAQGSIATLTISATDVNGKTVSDYSLVGTTAKPLSITCGTQMTAVTAPVNNSDTFSTGVKTYKYAVGTTSGNYNCVVDLTAWNASSTPQAAITVPYTISGDGSVSNAEVLKSIVALIASINKQIAALQKLILARR